MKIAIIVVLALAGLAVIFSMIKSRHFFKSIVTSVFQGIASMMAVNVLGMLTGVTVAVNWYTLVCVSVFGIPSTITLVLLDTFLI
ncbi:MAG: pro-sigmaK processing inhibitor BofA family protein [Clostridia bacterium]|nr:pro-sigmaK processing inhibitor BofA family protein [Clostridia bacterium]